MSMEEDEDAPNTTPGYNSHEGRQIAPTMAPRPIQPRISNAMSDMNSGNSRNTPIRGAGHMAFDKYTVDITRQVATWSRGIPSGHLKTVPDFDLFESVSAIEIGDPKMDSGAPQNQNDLDTTYDTSTRLSNSEIIWILDMHLGCLMNWNRGFPLAQTLFTSVYVEKLLSPDPKHPTVPKTIDDIKSFFSHQEPTGGDADIKNLQHPLSFQTLTINLFVVMVIKCCGLAIDSIIESQVPIYEEEDISLHTLGRDLLPAIKLGHIEMFFRDFLSQAERWDITTQSVDSPKRSPLAGIVLRMQFLHKLLVAMERDISPSERISSLTSAQSKLADIKKLGSEISPVDGVFDPQLQRRLASTSPLRPLVLNSPSDALSHASDFIEGLRTADWTLRWGEWENPSLTFRRSCQQFAFNESKKLPLVRAYSFHSIWRSPNESFEFLMVQDILSTVRCWPARDLYHRAYGNFPQVMSYPHPDEPSSYRAVLDFCQRAVEMGGGYIDVLRAFCSNSCRLRRTLCRCVKAFEELEQCEAVEADNILSADNRYHDETASRPMTTWSRTLKLEIMQTIIEMGFHLDMYALSEMVYIYSYLAMVYNARIDLIRFQKQKLNENLSSFSIDGFGVKLDSQLRINTEELNVIEAMLRLHRVLHWLDIVPGLKFSENQNIKRWDLRMKPFWPVREPAPPTWQEVSGYCELDWPRIEKGHEVESDHPVLLFLGEIHRELETASIQYQAQLRHFHKSQYIEIEAEEKLLLAKHTTTMHIISQLETLITCLKTGEKFNLLWETQPTKSYDWYNVFHTPDIVKA
ncbi:hypothetical protein BT63DRAFT_422554 [Microthyrium microscopicum]|uniref:Mak10-domain-containing protein n=1 Tax=Microthyrium microscopicum TaxID=703497 RepID=A0A6A6UMB5_9PEZI|nr:hypothetical protein BT63DRAFT_422554 [Microthyrium microscopicum]